TGSISRNLDGAAGGVSRARPRFPASSCGAADQRTSCCGSPALPLPAGAEVDPAAPWRLARSSSMMGSSARATRHGRTDACSVAELTGILTDRRDAARRAHYSAPSPPELRLPKLRYLRASVANNSRFGCGGGAAAPIASSARLCLLLPAASEAS